MKTGRFTVLIWIAIGFALFPGVSLAHKVNVFAYQEAETVFTESYFGDGTPCRGAAITASDENGAVVAEGITDEEGKFSFLYGKNRKLRIHLRASMGHAQEITLVMLGPEEVSQVKEPGENADPPKGNGPAPPVGFPASEEAVQRIVESRITPLRDSLMELRKKLEKPTLEKVVGGLGWIVGIAGAYLWGASRRRNRDKVKG